MILDYGRSSCGWPLHALNPISGGGIKSQVSFCHATSETTEEEAREKGSLASGILC